MITPKEEIGLSAAATEATVGEGNILAKLWGFHALILTTMSLIYDAMFRKKSSIERRSRMNLYERRAETVKRTDSATQTPTSSCSLLPAPSLDSVGAAAGLS